jgi:hypothetical protein
MPKPMLSSSTVLLGRQFGTGLLTDRQLVAWLLRLGLPADLPGRRRSQGAHEFLTSLA